MHDHKDGPAPVSTRLIAGFVSGIAGAFACNPFELVKTRLMAQVIWNRSLVDSRQYYSFIIIKEVDSVIIIVITLAFIMINFHHAISICY
jgi:hypothetical protein